MDNGVTLHAERLTLRPPEPDDTPALVAQIDDLAVARWLARVAHPFSTALGADFVARIRRERLPIYAIDAGAGLIGIIEAGDELGYWLGRAHWGQGFATEAAEVALTQAFAEPQRTGVRSGYFLGNAGSARVLAKLGFAPTSVEPVHCLARGETLDHQNMWLSREDWEQRHG